MPLLPKRPSQMVGETTETAVTHPAKPGFSFSTLLTPARITLAITWLTATAAFILGVVGTFPKGWQNAALAVVAILGHITSALKFLDGNSKWETALLAQQTTVPQPISAGTTVYRPTSSGSSGAAYQSE